MKTRLLKFSLPLAGLLALAVAMGIGRFAFTPILPMMQADKGLSLADGGWLASANYLGYLLGALLATRLTWSADQLLQRGLWLVVLMTAAMGLGDYWMAWLLWRLLAGIASAWVLIGTAALCISRLNASGQSERGGLVFSGVGFGVAFAGLACMGLTLAGVSSSQAWLWLAVAAWLGLLGSATLWRDIPSLDAATTIPPQDSLATDNSVQEEADTPLPPDNDHATASQKNGFLNWSLILCYGVYGFGYILPATFLPAQARILVPDPWLFSLSWPVFGLASAFATLIASRLLRRYTRPQVWAVSHVIMAVGVILPVFWQALPALLIAATCVGSTFMVITMVGLQQAQASVPRHMVKHQMAAMTASFAMGQLSGPVFFSITHDWLGLPLEFALVLGAAGLLAGVRPILRLQARPATA